jgi:hypothetical protein
MACLRRPRIEPAFFLPSASAFDSQPRDNRTTRATQNPQNLAPLASLASWRFLPAPQVARSSWVSQMWPQSARLADANPSTPTGIASKRKSKTAPE